MKNIIKLKHLYICVCAYINIGNYRSYEISEISDIVLGSSSG